MPKLNPPKRFICPLSKTLMKNPVKIADGYSYELQAIESWLKEHNVSPLNETNSLSNKNTLPNLNLKEEIDAYRLKYKICTSEEFYQAVKLGDVAKVDRLNYLEEHLRFSEIIDDNDELEEDYHFTLVEDHGTALMQAVRSNNYNMTKYLLENGANPNDALFDGWDSGWSPLHQATSHDNYSLVKLLLNYGANPDVRAIGHDDEERPVDIARNNNSEIAALLTYHFHRRSESQPSQIEEEEVINTIGFRLS